MPGGRRTGQIITLAYILTFRLALIRRHVVDEIATIEKINGERNSKTAKHFAVVCSEGRKSRSPGRFSIPLPRDMEPVRTDEGGWASAGVDEGRETAKADGDGGGRRAALITVLYYKN
ncbi:hypothetical protein DBV15_07107 [Temnothorax longispinosus]|uniref:Uncharacterized protein n=1 Tax=Temnothorax longispinosus TaxID=300112 RepID=A0A4S2KSX9_9HYME|nr:hypothetical protein DBV15_07107 [Temnothorax longispinosus]